MSSDVGKTQDIDHFKLLCDFGELSWLFSESADIDSFLHRVVAMVARHMNAAACTVFLYDAEAEELVLRATEGMSQECVGSIRLEMGEGLTFSLSGTLMGSDWYIHEHPEASADRMFRAIPRDRGADRVASLPSQVVTGAGDRTRTVTLTKEFDRSDLDEDSEADRDAGRDDSHIDTTYDELYAQLTLRNTYTQIEVSRTSHIFRL